MDDHPESELRQKITASLMHKAVLRQQVSDHTLETFELLKETLHELSTELDDELDEKIDKRIRLEYRDRGKFEAQVQLGDDLLIFTMHTDVFKFHREHAIWSNPYVADDHDNAYCGVINIYNFLSDSFKYNRAEDEGYLIGRIFINRGKYYFVEGKQQNSLRCNKFGSRQIDRNSLTEIIETAMYYSLNFDLLVPAYGHSKTVTVGQFNTKLETSKFRTGKRLGFDFEHDDI